MIVLSATDIRALVDEAALIPAIDAVMRRVSEGRGQLPLRSAIPVGGGNRFGVMPGVMDDGYGAKLLSLFPDNPRHGRSSHTGLYLLFDPATGLPVACLDAAVLTALRTPAASAMATRVLARADASVLALIGCGEQAAHHIAAMRAVRPVARVLVWGRNADRAAAFARTHGAEIAPSIAAAIAAADIVCTTTNSEKPLVTPEMLRPGLHLNAVGASLPIHQEIAPECLPRVKLFTDYLPSLEAQAGEVAEARRRGVIAPDHPVTEIGKVLSGAASGRRDDRDVTIYRSLGIAAQDIAAAQFIVGRARETGRGIVVQME
jgi:ornithine cyclodeaminase/alanine dehydrogenase-like protein (mu-crystallin family)